MATTFAHKNFVFLDNNRVLILVHLHKRISNRRWHKPQPAILLIDKTQKGFYLVNGISDPISIDANSATSKDMAYVLSRGKITRYNIPATSDNSGVNNQNELDYKIITGRSATNDSSEQ